MLSSASTEGNGPNTGAPCHLLAKLTNKNVFFSMSQLTGLSLGAPTFTMIQASVQIINHFSASSISLQTESERRVIAQLPKIYFETCSGETCHAQSDFISHIRILTTDPVCPGITSACQIMAQKYNCFGHVWPFLLNKGFFFYIVLRGNSE